MKERKKKRKKKYKKLTKYNIFKPKRLTLRNYTGFTFPLIDRYNWGYINDDNEKSFRYSQDWIDRVPYKSYIKLREKYRSKKHHDYSIDDHLKARQHPDWFLFYTSNPFSDLCLLCGDIDPIENYGYQECLQALLISDNYSYRSTTIKITGFV